jgi:hypothetical protein
MKLNRSIFIYKDLFFLIRKTLSNLKMSYYEKNLKLNTINKLESL